MTTPTTLLLYLGTLYLLTILYRLLRFIHLYTRTGSLSRYHYTSPSSSPPWALITGSSDGIGLGFAHELAAKNFNIILHGRNPVKLSNIQSLLSTQYPNVQFKVVVADSSLTGPEMLTDIERIVDSLKGVHLTVLVNNVGGPPPGMSPLYTTFGESKVKDIDATIALNIRFTALLTNKILPLWKDTSSPRLILNVGSIAEIGAPLAAVYGGTKAWITSWTKGMRREMKGEGRDVEVLAVLPLLVTGVSFRKKEAGVMLPDIRMFARNCLRLVGCGRAVVLGWWVHAIEVWLFDLVPAGILDWVLWDMVKKEEAVDKKRD
jgi:17beta-estradiol 17-dehydrogenase / very-long-chain 3-oxoacyl-CoA reductase